MFFHTQYFLAEPEEGHVLALACIFVGKKPRHNCQNRKLYLATSEPHSSIGRTLGMDQERMVDCGFVIPMSYGKVMLQSLAS